MPNNYDNGVHRVTVPTNLVVNGPFNLKAKVMLLVGDAYLNGNKWVTQKYLRDTLMEEPTSSQSKDWMYKTLLRLAEEGCIIREHGKVALKVD